MYPIRSYSLTLLFIFLFSFNNFTLAADIVAGKNKASACLGCHGINGNSINPQFPSLAGQRAMYLDRQLKAFQSGQRISSIMQGIVSNLTKQDIINLSAYFSSLPSKSAGGDATLAKKGKDKFSMCTGCHGALAQGRGGFPKLAGQQPLYLERQLLNFKNRSRKGGPMNAMTSSLSEQDIKEIAAYLANL